MLPHKNPHPVRVHKETIIGWMGPCGHRPQRVCRQKGGSLLLVPIVPIPSSM